MMTRIPIMDVEPVVEDGRYAAKAAVGELFPVRARVFREGHDRLGAGVVLTGPDGTDRPFEWMTHLENDHYVCWVSAEDIGTWTFRIESWSDPYATWLHDAPIKVAAQVDTELMLTEGALLLDRAVAGLPKGSRADASALRAAAKTMRARSRSVPERLAAGVSPEIEQVMHRHPLRDLLDSSPTYPVHVDRERALVSSWYEFFPRSEGGTFATAAKRLDAVADMGFDVVYLPPIHPIGRVNRKGPNNTMQPLPDDPGSPWAIGSTDGGHDAIHPELGTIDDFDAFVARARELGLEVALDFALNCAPDHPWVGEHPEWFTTRADGTIAYAENPPKKYQDIYPLNFDNDYEGLYAEIMRVLRYWMDHDVRIFRVDNPHTKPVGFWEQLIAEIRTTDPDIIFLAEAFTRPAMMRALGTVGFHQSYTYFTWRVTKPEVESYFSEVAHETSHVMRPNFFVNTPDILPFHLQSGDPAIFKVRAVLAATGSPSWGVYSGFELYEHLPLSPGREEYLDSEKYQLRERDWASASSLAPFLTRLNEIRREHPALRQLRDLTLHDSTNDQVVCYSKRRSTVEGDDVVIVVASLAPNEVRATTVRLDLPELGLDWGDSFAVHDELTGQTFTWSEYNYVVLDPTAEPAHVLTLNR